MIFLLFLNMAPVFSQNKPAQLSAEITAIEKKLADSKLSAPARKAALETLARLYELSGNIEAAAGTWEKAARAVPGDAGHAGLLQSALCYTAIGEFDRAETVLEPVLTGSANKAMQIQARLVSAQIDALKTGSTAALSGLLSNPDFTGIKPALYYSLWRISADPSYQSAMATRLISEYPQSPEARIVRSDNSVSAVPAAFWLLAGSENTAVVTGASAIAAVTHASNPDATQPPTVQPAAGSGPLMLQTGLFSKEENAGNLANKLRAAGFSPVTEKRGSDRWVVGVLPGSDYLSTMRLLKDKGFDSFPVY